MGKIGIVISEFNREIGGQMLRECLRGFKEQNIVPIVVRVPGAFEIPYAAQELILKHKVKCLVALGVVIKGETDHYDRICEMCSQGIASLSLKYRVPIIFEVLMCDKVSKAKKRIGKAYEASRTAIKMLKLNYEFTDA